MSIGEFSRACQLSPKALRLYDQLALLVPARVDAVTGYRWYTPEQVQRARLVALLRRIDVPLALLAQVLEAPPRQGAAAVRAHAGADAAAASERAGLAEHACHLINPEEDAVTATTTYQVQGRHVIERAVLSATRHAHAEDLGAVLGALLGAMSASGPGLGGMQGCPYLVHHGEVSADSDGPVEVVRPMADLATARRSAERLGDVQARVEPAHDEAFVVLTMAQTRGAENLEALDALERHVRAGGGVVASTPRQVMVGSWRTAGPQDLVCHLSAVLRRPQPAGAAA